MRVKSGVAAATAALVAVGAVGFVASQAPGDPVAVPAPVVQSFAPEMLSSEDDPAAQPDEDGPTKASPSPTARKLPASGSAAKEAPTIPPHSGPLIDAFEYQEDPFLPRPGEGQSPTTIVPDVKVEDTGATGELLAVPVQGRETSQFGMRFHPVLKRWKLHTGLDFGAPCGTPIGASAAGRVTRVGYGGGYGNMIMIDHGKIGGHNVVTLYAHLSAAAVRVGDQVEQGQGIGRVGNTGYSTGCHLHFEVRVDGTFANPKDWLEGRMVVNPEINEEVAFEPEPSPSPSASPSPGASDSPSPSVSTSPSASTSPSGTPDAASPSAPAESSPSQKPSPSETQREPSKPVEPSQEPSTEQPPKDSPSPSKSPSPSPSPSTSPSASASGEPTQPPSSSPGADAPSTPAAPSEEPKPEPPAPSE